MFFYRNRAFILHLITFGLAFVIGCLITLATVNVKNCQSEIGEQLHPVSSIFLVIVILSAPKNVVQRDAIRQTWLNLKPKIDKFSHETSSVNDLEFYKNGFLHQDTVYQQSFTLDHFIKKISTPKTPNQNELNVKILHYFAIGSENLPFIESNALAKEHAKHNDLLLLNDLSDSYANLTLKLLKTITAVGNIESFEYMLKTDDDTYVKLDYLLEDLYEYEKSIKHKKTTVNSIKPELYWGYFNGRATIKTHGQWKEANFNLCDRYLPYALGGGYVLSKNLVHFIAENHHTLSRYVSEDISVGVWLSSHRNVYRKHDPRFDTGYLPRKCRNYHIVLHKRTPEHMKDAYRGFLCTFKQANDSRVRRPAEYFYDWARPQTQCCDTLVDNN